MDKLRLKDLRVGSIVEYYNPKKEEWEIKVCNTITLKAIEDSTPGKFYRPIPLTEEWILKFGFEFNGECLCYYKEDFNIQLNFENKPSFWFENPINSDELLLSSVHTLQNLYFALTQKELEFKKEKPFKFKGPKGPAQPLGDKLDQGDNGNIPKGYTSEGEVI